METKVTILLLEDTEMHFNQMKEIIEKILKKDFRVVPEFVFSYEENAEITKYENNNGYFHKSKYGGSDEMKENYRKIIDSMLQQKLQSFENVITIIDILWDTGDKSDNRYGREFYEMHLKKLGILPLNTIFVSNADEERLGEYLTTGFNDFIPKRALDESRNTVEFSTPFEKAMKKAIARCILYNRTIQSKQNEIPSYIHQIL